MAIGTHDLDRVEGPFVFDAEDPRMLKFVPLNQDKEFSASELMEFYSVGGDDDDDGAVLLSWLFGLDGSVILLLMMFFWFMIFRTIVKKHVL